MATTLLTFTLATLADLPLIKQWWHKPHVIEFWDNSPEMWQNVENYLYGKKDLFDYWIGSLNNVPFTLIMTSKLETESELTFTLDIMIGEENFLGKGLASLTLNAFAEFLKAKGIKYLIIDPATHNQKAVRAYQRAGFKIINTFVRESGYFAGIKHYMMKLKLI